MKNRKLALVAALLTPFAANAGLINGGFEDGLNGYTVGTLTGIGSANVVTSNTTNYSPGNWFGTPVTTTDGTCFGARRRRTSNGRAISV